MTDLPDMIGKLLGAVVVGVIAYLTPKVRAWLSEMLGSQKTEKLQDTVMTMVEAAEQLYKTENGAVRKAYVVEQLSALNIAITGEVNAMIEACVWKLNGASAPQN